MVIEEIGHIIAATASAVAAVCNIAVLWLCSGNDEEGGENNDDNTP